MAVSGMNHFTVLTDDVPRTVEFYARLLGSRTARGRTSAFPARGCMRGDDGRSCTSSAASRASSFAPASSTTWRSRRRASPIRSPR